MRAFGYRLILAVLFVLLAGILVGGCGYRYERVKTGHSTIVEMEQTETNHQKLVAATPPPLFEHSLERENLVYRLKFWNVQNRQTYIYILGNDGDVIDHFTVIGKVSSTESLLTTPEQVAPIPRPGNGYEYVKLPSPDFDGSYGKNSEGIFFKSVEAGMVETNCKYLLTEVPRKITGTVRLQSNVDLEKVGK